MNQYNPHTQASANDAFSGRNLCPSECIKTPTQIEQAIQRLQNCVSSIGSTIVVTVQKTSRICRNEPCNTTKDCEKRAEFSVELAENIHRITDALEQHQKVLADNNSKIEL